MPIRSVRRSPCLPLLLAAALLALSAFPRKGTLAAQDTGTLLVMVRTEDSVPLAGAFVRSDRHGAAANEAGIATVQLPARLVSVRVSHPGFASRRFDITILPDVAQRFDLVLVRQPPGWQARSGRTVGPLSDQPLAATVIGPDQLDALVPVGPTDLSRAIDAIPGVEVQGQPGPLDATRAWSGGAGGQYTGLLVDGLPMFGGGPSGYNVLQAAPLEFEQIEWIRGPATALYGPTVPGSLVNLIPRRPTADQVRFGINQSSEKGGDLSLWAARRQSATLSGSVYADFHQQRLVDSDDDGWGEFPRAIRFSVRPRLYLDRPNGDGASLSAGFMSEERTGGFLLVNTGDDIYREERRHRRFDASLSARRTVGDLGSLRVRAGTVVQSVGHRFDDLRERDRRTTFFAEASYLAVMGRATLIGGVAWFRDALRQQDYPAFDHTHTYPSAFGSVTVAAGERLTAALAGRCDDHNVHGPQCVPRVDLLFRPGPTTELRLYGAAGYSAPLPTSGDAEVLGLHVFFPIGVRAERTSGFGADLRWRRHGFRVDAALGLTRIADPVRIVPLAGDTEGRLRLLNLAEPTRVVAADLAFGYAVGQWTLGASYGLRTGSEGRLDGPGRRDLVEMPTHQTGLDLEWTAPGNAGTAASARLRYFGGRDVADNPSRTETPGYALLDGVVSQRSGRATLYFSVQNLFDVKLGNYEPVFLAQPTVGGRRTNTPWAPLRGRVISLGAMVDWLR